MIKPRYQHCSLAVTIALLIVVVLPYHYHAQNSNLHNQNEDNERSYYTATRENIANQKANNLNKENIQTNIYRTSSMLSNQSPGRTTNRQKRSDHFKNTNSLYTKEIYKVTPKHYNLSLSNKNADSNYTKPKSGSKGRLQPEEIDHAVEYGLKEMRELYSVKEPQLYKLGVFLKEDHPAYSLAYFRSPNEKALNYARYGYAAVQARRKLAEMFIDSRDFSSSQSTFRSELFLEECPLQGSPRCFRQFKRYRTADGTCNNLKNRWRGASMLPMQRFLAPHYEDGIQSVRRAVSGASLPSARAISSTVHRDSYREAPAITMMFMQWGQFLDHDIISSAQSRMFNRSVPQCCADGSRGTLPPDLTHPECLPIPVSDDDWFLGRFGIRCIEFVRSAPTSRIDCDLGWREQINQATAYIDASPLYGSDPQTADSLRRFSRGQLTYGRTRGRGPLQPPDPPEGELCRLGAITTDCFRGGDVRVGDQPGLTAVHTIWLRYHNKVANALANLNPHWKDEKLYQESRRIVGALVQHITYKEFLPILLGRDVIMLFELKLEREGYYNGYNHKVNPAPANAFGTAAFRFGHSLVQSSFIRTDSKHRIIPNNVTLHEEQQNVENIWSLGSLDRLILGLSNQPIQKRDEFISDELTNHLFQTPSFPFGMDLAAVNIQRGRDHGIPSYTAWREPCGLSPLRNWTDLEKVMSAETARRFQLLYEHLDDIDLFSGGLAEKPVRGGLVGPTFACIIAQQFSNLRRGDRFWYENGSFKSSFTPAQLRQIRRATFAHVLCKTTGEVETLQPFVFLSPDNSRNRRSPCDSATMNAFDLGAWKEDPEESAGFSLFSKEFGSGASRDFSDYDDYGDITFADSYDDDSVTTNERRAGGRNRRIAKHSWENFTISKKSVHQNRRLATKSNFYMDISTASNLNFTDNSKTSQQSKLTNIQCHSITTKTIPDMLTSKPSITKTPYVTHGDKIFFSNWRGLDNYTNYINRLTRLEIIIKSNHSKQLDNYDINSTTRRPFDSYRKLLSDSTNNDNKQKLFTEQTITKPTTNETKHKLIPLIVSNRPNANRQNNYYEVLTTTTIPIDNTNNYNFYPHTTHTTDSTMTTAEKTTFDTFFKRQSSSKTRQTINSNPAPAKNSNIIKENWHNKTAPQTIQNHLETYETAAVSKSYSNKFGNNKKKLNLVLPDLERAAEGIRGEEWKMYNQIEDAHNPLVIFDIMNLQNEEFSTSELPKPLNLTYNIAVAS